MKSFKIIAFMLSLVIALSMFAGCGTQTTEGSASSASTENQPTIDTENQPIIEEMLDGMEQNFWADFTGPFNTTGDTVKQLSIKTVLNGLNQIEREDCDLPPTPIDTITFAVQQNGVVFDDYTEAWLNIHRIPFSKTLKRDMQMTISDNTGKEMSCSGDAVILTLTKKNFRLFYDLLQIVLRAFDPEAEDSFDEQQAGDLLTEFKDNDIVLTVTLLAGQDGRFQAGKIEFTPDKDNPVYALYSADGSDCEFSLYFGTHKLTLSKTASGDVFLYKLIADKIFGYHIEYNKTAGTISVLEFEDSELTSIAESTLDNTPTGVSATLIFNGFWEHPMTLSFSTDEDTFTYTDLLTCTKDESDEILGYIDFNLTREYALRRYGDLITFFLEDDSASSDSTDTSDTTEEPIVPVSSGKTSVTFRSCLKNWGNYADANLYLYQYASPDDEEPLENTRSLPLYRLAKWQTTVEMEPGYYSAMVFPNNLLGSIKSCSTSTFEVKGDKMTVYICVNIDDAVAPKPEQWLVYGEDKQEFYIWGGPEDPDNRFKK